MIVPRKYRIEFLVQASKDVIILNNCFISLWAQQMESDRLRLPSFFSTCALFSAVDLLRACAIVGVHASVSLRSLSDLCVDNTPDQCLCACVGGPRLLRQSIDLVEYSVVW